MTLLSALPMNSQRGVRVTAASALLGFGIASCGTPAPGPPTSGKNALTLGESHPGQYHLGPVDFSESQYHNACAPGGGYRPEMRESVGLSGEYIAGVSNQLSQNGGICDACMRIETEAGESIVARIVTYGEEQASGDIDVSPNVFEAIHHGEYPRSMTWSLVRCPESGSILLEYKQDSNPWWTALWVRNAEVPLGRLAAIVGGQDAEQELRRESDGSWVLDSGFGEGKFTLVMTDLLDNELRLEFASFPAGGLVDSGENFAE